MTSSHRDDSKSLIRNLKDLVPPVPPKLIRQAQRCLREKDDLIDDLQDSDPHKPCGY